MLIYLKIIVTVVFSLFIISCETISDKHEQEDLTFILQSSFEGLSLAKYGSEFPRSKKRSKECVQNNDKPCLIALHRFTNAKKTITTLPANKALDITLDIIGTACLSKYERIANSVCYGGIVSLYVYTCSEQNIKILARVKKYPKKVQSLIFNSDFLWFHNRPNYHEWINYISVADVDWKDKLQKPFVLNLFKTNIYDLEYEEKHWPFLNWQRL